jgi:hypothetical protein
MVQWNHVHHGTNRLPKKERELNLNLASHVWKERSCQWRIHALSTPNHHDNAAVTSFWCAELHGWTCQSQELHSGKTAARPSVISLFKFHSTRDSLSVLAASSSMLSLCLLFGMGQNRNIPFHPVKRGTLSYRLFGLEHKSHSWISRLLIQLAIAGSQLAPNLLTLFPGQLTW